MKTCSISLMGGIQIKLTMRYHFTPIRLREKKVMIPKFGEGNGGNKMTFFNEGGNSVVQPLRRST